MSINCYHLVIYLLNICKNIIIFCYITKYLISICSKKMLYIYIYILGVVKKNPLFLHEIEWKNNGFLFTTSNIYIYTRFV